jgi:hypothetical protein
MINISRVLASPAFQQSFTVYRKSGDFAAGGYVEAETTVNMTGVVLPTTYKDIMQVPEGDRVSESKTFYSTSPLYVTRNNSDGTSGTSDEIVHHGFRYRLYQVKDYQDYGYFKAMGMRMQTD